MAAIAVGLAAYGVWWRVLADRVQETLNGIQGEQKALGRNLEWNALKIEGFPYLVDATLSKTRLLAPDIGTVWDGERVVVRIRPLSPGSIRISLEGPQHFFHVANGRWIEISVEADKALKHVAGVAEVLSHLRWLASRLDGALVTFDLADLRGYAYYSGIRFAIYGSGEELARGGRYDEVGAVFGRKRPAAGFSLDLKELVSVLPARPLRPAVRAPWGADPQLRRAIAGLRAEGQTVVCVLPGHEHEVHEFECDRELVCVSEHWLVQALDRSA